MSKRHLLKKAYAKMMPMKFLKFMGKNVVKIGVTSYRVNGCKMDWSTLQLTAQKVYNLTLERL